MAPRPLSTQSSRAYGRGLAEARREHYELRLYVTDMTPRCAVAFANLTRVCEEHLAGRYTIEVIDVLVHPQRAKADQIVAIPTVVRQGPPPVRRVIGDLSSPERVLTGLGLRPGE